MIKAKETTFNGLLLSSSRPLHPIVSKYLTNLGVSISYEDGYIILDGNFKVPGQQTLFAQLAELSKREYGEIVFDLAPQVNTHKRYSFNTKTYENVESRTFEVVEKNPNKKQISSIPFKNFPSELLDLLFIEYLLIKDAVIYLDSDNQLCYMAGNEPLDAKELIAEVHKFYAMIIEDLKIQHNTNLSNNTVQNPTIDPIVLDLLTIKYLLTQGCEVILNHEGNLISFGGNYPESEDEYEQELFDFQTAELAKLNAVGVHFGIEELKSTSKTAPRPRL